MNTNLPTIKKQLPTLAELYKDKAIIDEHNKLNIILNAEPKKEWIKAHPFVKNLMYLPIERVEYLLTMIFAKWWVEVKEIKLIANSLCVTIRLYVLDPITGTESWQDGIGAMPIQVAKGSGATEFDKMNSSAVQIGLPAAESFAIKDAAEKFGRIFGKDLNRKDNIAYSDRLLQSIDANETLNNPSISQEIRDKVSNTQSKEQLQIVALMHRGLGKEFDKLVVAQKKFLENVEKDEHANS